jgi:hypothetical protein
MRRRRPRLCTMAIKEYIPPTAEHANDALRRYDERGAATAHWCAEVQLSVTLSTRKPSSTPTSSGRLARDDQKCFFADSN